MLTAIGYILLTFLIVVYITIMLQIWKHNRDAKTEWQQYWDDVFNNQKK